MTESIVKPLSAAEEGRLIVDAQGGNERAMTRLMEAYAPAIERAARKYADKYDPEDALQEARVQFLSVVHAHDFDKADRLDVYVRARMEQEMKDALSETANVWGIPARTVQRFHQIYAKADGDLNLGAELAPSYEMASLTFLSIAEMLQVGSLDAPAGEDGGTVEDVYTLEPVGREQEADAYDALVESLTVAHMMRNPISDAHRRIIRAAYGFEGDLDTGEGIAEVQASTVALVAHPDATVAAALTWQDGGEPVWTRPTVQRMRAAQLAAWRAEYTKDNVKAVI